MLGSTGSIGVQALQVIDAAPDLEACGLSCGTNAALMAEQAEAHGILHTACAGGGGSLGHGDDLGELIDASEPDIVLNALVGAAGLQPTLAALERGVAVALANKESLVAGGDLLRTSQATGARLVPVDSEHSAIFQVLDGPWRPVARPAILTASGGPFRGRGAEMEGARPRRRWRTRTWTMGAKITIDSATLMNKGLEVIEAPYLFDLARADRGGRPPPVDHPLDGRVRRRQRPGAARPARHAGCRSATPRHPAPLPPGEPMDLVGRRLDFEPPDRAAFPRLGLARPPAAREAPRRPR